MSIRVLIGVGDKIVRLVLFLTQNTSCGSYFSPKTQVVGTKKNHLNEAVLLITQNKCLNWWLRKYSQFYAQKNVFKIVRSTGRDCRRK